MRRLLSTARKLFRQGDDGLPVAPRVPDGYCVYAVGDVHGESGCLDRLLSMIAADAEARFERDGVHALVIFLGDYVDRGADSRGVLDRLIGLSRSSAERVTYRFLRGNHEAAMLDFLRQPMAGWLSFGGIETLSSYGIRASAGITSPARLAEWSVLLDRALPAAHIEFLECLETLAVVGDYAFVHAGVVPGVPLDRQKTEDLLWIREPFLSSSTWHGKKIVHGHTVVDAPENTANRLGIDTGAYASGVLTAAVLSGGDVDFLQASAHGPRS